MVCIDAIFSLEEKMKQAMNRCTVWCSIVLAIGCGSVHAQTPTEALLADYLPLEAVVKDALISSPLIQVARAKREGWSARAKGISAGSAEFILRSTSQQRHDVVSGAQMYESMVSIERPLRLWGKRGIDADLALKTQTFADIEYADAMHEGSRELLKFWFAYMRALADQKNAITTFSLAQKMQSLTSIKFKQGEVSKLDTELASAEFERISAARSLADSQLASASSALLRRYPMLALPVTLPVALSVVPGEFPALPEFKVSMVAMRGDFLEKNHELNMMRVDAQRLRLAADRAARDHLPDPTLGVFMGRERAGAETIAGVMFSMPLPGAARAHHASAVMADAQAASDKVALAEQQLGALFESMWIQFQHKKTATENLNSAAQRQALAAEKSVKAYALGEGNLSEVLLIARMASDNLNAAERMQIDVIELLALIRLDLHQIWDFDE